MPSGGSAPHGASAPLSSTIPGPLSRKDIEKEYEALQEEMHRCTHKGYTIHHHGSGKDTAGDDATRKELDETKKQLQELQCKLKEVLASLIQRDGYSSVLQNQLAKATNAISQKEKELNAALAGNGVLKRANDDLQTQYNDLQTKNKALTISEQRCLQHIDKLQNEYDSLKRTHTQCTPDRENAASAASRIAELEARVAGLKQAYSEKGNENIKRLLEIGALEREIQSLKRENAGLNATNEEQRRQIGNLQERLNESTTAHTHCTSGSAPSQDDEIARLNEFIKQLQDKNTRLAAENRNGKDQIKTLQDKAHNDGKEIIRIVAENQQLKLEVSGLKEEIRRLRASATPPAQPPHGNHDDGGHGGGSGPPPQPPPRGGSAGGGGGHSGDGNGSARAHEEIQELQRTISSLKNTNSSLCRTAEVYKERIKNLEAEITTLRDTIQRKDAKIAELEGINGRNNGEIEKLKADIIALHGTNQRITELEAAMQGQRARITELEDINGRNNREIETLKADITTLHGTIREKDAKIVEQEGTIREKDAKIAEQGRDIQKKDETITQLNGSCNQWASEFSKLQGELTETTRQAGAKIAKLEELHTEGARVLHQRDTTIAELNAQITKGNAELQQKDTTIAELNAQITKGNAELQQKDETIRDLNTEINTKNKATDEYSRKKQIEYNKLKNESDRNIQALQTTLEEYKAEIQRLNDVGNGILHNTNATILSQRQEIERLQTAITGYQNKIDGIINYIGVVKGNITQADEKQRASYIDNKKYMPDQLDAMKNELHNLKTNMTNTLTYQPAAPDGQHNGAAASYGQHPNPNNMTDTQQQTQTPASVASGRRDPSPMQLFTSLIRKLPGQNATATRQYPHCTRLPAAQALCVSSKPSCSSSASSAGKPLDLRDFKLRASAPPPPQSLGH